MIRIKDETKNLAQQDNLKSFFDQKETDCILYSEEGVEFKIHKEILGQTQFLRNILSSNKDKFCTNLQIFCPCSKRDLEFLVRFLYTGIISCGSELDAFKILINLSGIFGFPKERFLPNNYADIEKEFEITKPSFDNISESNEIETQTFLRTNSRLEEKEIEFTNEVTEENTEETKLFDSHSMIPTEKENVNVGFKESIRNDIQIKIPLRGRKQRKKRDIILSKKASKNVIPIDGPLVRDEKSPFKCVICKKAFKTRPQMNAHIERVHDEKKPYKCNICNSRFNSITNQKKHITSAHEENKPFKCDRCDASCTQKYLLKMHVAFVHEGKRPFQCNICSASFQTKQHRKRHIASIHEGKKSAFSFE